MARRAGWPLIAAAVVAAQSANAQIVTLPLPGTEAGIVVQPGPQSEPALSSPFGSFVAYTDQARVPSEVWYCRLEGLLCPAFQVPVSNGNQYAPAVAGDVLVYVDEGLAGPRKGNVVRLSLSQGYSSPVSPVDASQGRPAVSDRLIAWEDDRDPVNGTDIWVHDNLLGGEWAITGPGIQRMPRASGTLVTYLDQVDGAVRVYDLASGATTVASQGPAAFADVDGAAVAVETLAGDLEVRSTGGQLLAALALTGLQSNPHISGDWVAFEDFSTLVSRVIVWNWKSGDLYAPPAGTSSQTLNDISWPRVVYVDDRNKATGGDIFLYDTSADGGTDGGTDGGADGGADGGTDGGTDGGVDGGTDGGGARCDDASALPLAELHLHRERSGPDADRVVFTAEAEMPVLVCIDADGVCAAWVLLDDEAVARPNEFNRRHDHDGEVVHLERRRSVVAGRNRLGAIIAGKPGSWLVVRLLPDPGGGPAPSAGSALRAPAPGPAALPEPLPVQGCSAGAAGLLAALPLGAWMLRRRRRRA